jgi:hypothetical protein
MDNWPGALARFIVHRWTRYVLSWLLGLGLAALHLHLAWHMYDVQPTGDPTKDRRDGNFGHTLVDFGGQWLTAHLVAVGRGRELYLRSAQREVLEAAYPRDDEPPATKDHDADSLLNWIMTAKPTSPEEPGISGPLYPPTHAVMLAPLGRLPPRQSYHVAQIVFLVSIWVAGLAVAGISRGRIWWPVASSFAMVFPGFGPSLHLGQNSALSLAILMVGWWLVTRGWDGAGGAVWGLFAYKPVWAVAFLLVPLLTRRWRMLAGMTAAGLALVLTTIPIVGIQSWFHWLRIGQAAADLYKVDQNWIFLSRDLLGIPRRWMLDFDIPLRERDRTDAALAGWAVWTIVVGITVLVALYRRRPVRPAIGYGPAFVALGAWASCFHFIYYDSLLAVLPITMLVAEPRRFVRPILLAVAPAPAALARYFGPRQAAEPCAKAVVLASPLTAAVLNSSVLTALAALILIEQAFTNLDGHATVSVGVFPRLRPLAFSTGQSGTPWDTFVLLALWAYCGVRILMEDASDAADGQVDVACRATLPSGSAPEPTREL